MKEQWPRSKRLVTTWYLLHTLTLDISRLIDTLHNKIYRIIGVIKLI